MSTLLSLFRDESCLFLVHNDPFCNIKTKNKEESCYEKHHHDIQRVSGEWGAEERSIGLHIKIT